MKSDLGKVGKTDNLNNFEDMESIQFFQKTMESQGVFDKLREMGIEDGDTVKIYDIEFEFYN